VVNGGAVEDVKAAIAAHAKEKAHKSMVALLNGIVVIIDDCCNIISLF
jgi:hypothetical protein